MTTMTIEQAKKVAEGLRDVGDTDAVALRVLADAFRAAEGQVAHLNAKLDATHTNRCFNCEQTVTEATTARQAAAVAQMREDAAKIADGVLDGPLPAGAFAIAVRISKAIRSLPAPAARTYDDGVRDAAKAIRDQATRIFGKPSTVANSYAEVVESLLSPAPAVAPVAQEPGPTTPDVKFDAEAALVAMRDLMWRKTYTAPATVRDIHETLNAALAAGRGGGR